MIQPRLILGSPTPNSLRMMRVGQSPGTTCSRVVDLSMGPEGPYGAFVGTLDLNTAVSHQVAHQVLYTHTMYTNESRLTARRPSRISIAAIAGGSAVTPIERFHRKRPYLQ